MPGKVKFSKTAKKDKKSQDKRILVKKTPKTIKVASVNSTKGE